MSQTELRYEQSPLRIDYTQKNLIRMNLNENLIFPQNLLRLLVAKCADKFEPRYYPSDLGEGELQKLASEIARYCGCSSSSVAIGVGSDQLIDLIFRMKLGGPRGKILTVDPTFSMYA